MNKYVSAWNNFSMDKRTPDNLKTQEICNKALRIDPYSLAFFSGCLKTQKMFDKAIEIDPFTL